MFAAIERREKTYKREGDNCRETDRPLIQSQKYRKIVNKRLQRESAWVGGWELKGERGTDGVREFHRGKGARQ